MTMSKTVVISSKNVYFTYTAINNSYFCTDTYPNRVIDRERDRQRITTHDEHSPKSINEIIPNLIP